MPLRGTVVDMRRSVFYKYAAPRGVGVDRKVIDRHEDRECRTPQRRSGAVSKSRFSISSARRRAAPRARAPRWSKHGDSIEYDGIMHSSFKFKVFRTELSKLAPASHECLLLLSRLLRLPAARRPRPSAATACPSVDPSTPAPCTRACSCACACACACVSASVLSSGAAGVATFPVRCSAATSARVMAGPCTSWKEALSKWALHLVRVRGRGRVRVGVRVRLALSKWALHPLLCGWMAQSL